jgi:hypothetical protein
LIQYRRSSLSRIRSSNRTAGSFEGIVHGEYERSAGASTGQIDLPGNPENAARAHRNSNSGSGDERHAEIRRSRAHQHSERPWMLSVAGDPPIARATGLADPSQDCGRIAVQGGVHQRSQPGSMRCGARIYGAVATLLEDCVPARGLGIVDGAQTSRRTIRGETPDTRRSSTAREYARCHRFTH